MEAFSRSRTFDIPDAVRLIQQCDTGYRITPNHTNFRDAYWLWDSAYLASGLASIDPARARAELERLMESQHANGMVPHVQLRRELRSASIKHGIGWGNVHDTTGNHLRTSGITQPPILATATRIVAERLGSQQARQQFLGRLYGSLVRYHAWFLRERDPNQDHVVTILHPWESGMDNSPSMLAGIKPTPLDRFLGHLTTPFRHDVREGLDAALRTPPAESRAVASLVRRLRAQNYNAERIFKDNPTYAVDSVLINCVLLQATKDLAWMAHELGEELPEALRSYLNDERNILARFWHAEHERFYDVDALTNEHITIPTISNLLPLLVPSALSVTQGNRIMQLLESEEAFSAPYPVPTVARHSHRFNPRAYWSGPMWPWMNRLLFYGAREAGEKEIARRLRSAVVEVVQQHGAFEHYSPLTGEPYGAKGFSPTAATFIELASVDVGSGR